MKSVCSNNFRLGFKEDKMTWDVMNNRFKAVAGPLPNTFDYLDMYGYELMVKADYVQDTLPPAIAEPKKCFGPDC